MNDAWGFRGFKRNTRGITCVRREFRGCVGVSHVHIKLTRVNQGISATLLLILIFLLADHSVGMTAATYPRPEHKNRI